MVDSMLLTLVACIFLFILWIRGMRFGYFFFRKFIIYRIMQQEGAEAYPGYLFTVPIEL